MPQVGRAAAFGALAVNFQAMSRHAKAMFGGDDVEDPRQGGILEFEQSAAFAANQVVVLRIPDHATDERDAEPLKQKDLFGRHGLSK